MKGERLIGRLLHGNYTGFVLRTMLGVITFIHAGDHKMLGGIKGMFGGVVSMYWGIKQMT